MTKTLLLPHQFPVRYNTALPSGASKSMVQAIKDRDWSFENALSYPKFNDFVSSRNADHRTDGSYFIPKGK